MIRGRKQTGPNTKQTDKPWKGPVEKEQQNKTDIDLEKWKWQEVLIDVAPGGHPWLTLPERREFGNGLTAGTILAYPP